MRIRAVIAGVCMLAVTVMLSTTAVQATQEGKKWTTYDVAVAICEWGNGPNHRYWEESGVVHELDTWHFGPQYVLFGGQWVNAGTFRADIAETVWGYTWGFVFGHNQGTFTMLGSPIGDVHGTFYWDWSDMTNSIATGTAAKRGRTVPVQMMLLLEAPSELPTPPYDPCNTGYVSYRYVRVTVPNSATPGPA